MFNFQSFNGKLVVTASLALFALLCSQMYATLNPSKTTIEVSIDGQPFGVFDSAEGLLEVNTQKDQTFKSVVLQRSFVSQPALSKWARDNVVVDHDRFKKIQIKRKDSNGRQVSITEFELSKPLAWSVERSKVRSKGYIETVELAVRKKQSLK